jgi:hypothetical protein
VYESGAVELGSGAQREIVDFMLPPNKLELQVKFDIMRIEKAAGKLPDAHS